MSLEKCDGCGKDIGIYVEFGGAYFTPDGDSYCNEACHEKNIDSIAKQTSTEEGLLSYLNVGSNFK